MAALAARPPLRAAEFYSGVGGWCYGAKRAVADLDVDVEIAFAVDASTTCNDVYAYNLNQRPSQRQIERLAKDDLEGLDGWLLSPPCQPHTRQRDPGDDHTDDRDPRAASFLHLAETLEGLERPPRFVCLENVVGFEASRCRERWHAALRRAGFARPKCWHLTPTLVGVPHERPRYFECAVRRDNEHDAARRDGRDWDAPQPAAAWPRPVSVMQRPVADFLEWPAALGAPGAADAVAPWLLPDALLEKDAAWCLDVVDATATTPTACFTRSYGRFARGTGSVVHVRDAADAPGLEELGLARSSPEARTFGDDWRGRAPRLRYFAPKEVANLLGFPKAFAFPPGGVSRKAAWAAMGNSLHVDAAAAVVRVALGDLGLA
mmetsp:Transcript_19699/g.60710  ORF Transcript_19699/g.60710 Transcript_19699/m.60710 type:complete len:377 (-) Transcript_19699:42-1172(-)